MSDHEPVTALTQNINSCFAAKAASRLDGSNSRRQLPGRRSAQPSTDVLCPEGHHPHVIPPYDEGPHLGHPRQHRRCAGACGVQTYLSLHTGVRPAGTGYNQLRKKPQIDLRRT